MDDRKTGYDVPGTIEARFEGAKMLHPDRSRRPGTVATLEQCGKAVTELNRAELIAMVEPFMSSRVSGKIVNDLSPDAVIKSVHIAQGLGASSAYTWMKLPVVHEMERVMDATTLPTLLLGGDPDGAPDETYAAWQAALALPSVRGLVVGRTMLYPADDDVAKAVDTAVSLVRSMSSMDIELFCLRSGHAGSSALRSRGHARVGGLGLLQPADACPRAGGDHRFDTGPDEVIVRTARAGRSRYEAGGPALRARRPGVDVFAGPTDVGLPAGLGQEVEPALRSRRPVRSLRCAHRPALPVALRRGSEVPVELRGAGQSSRLVRNFGTPGPLDAAQDHRL